MPCNRAREIDLEAFLVDPRAEEWAEFRAHQLHCPDCTRALAPLRTLVASLRTSGSETSAHPPEPLLVAFANGDDRLGTDERDRVLRHVAGCASCRTEVAVLQRFDLAGHNAPDPVSDAPAAAAGPREALARLGAAIAPRLLRPLLASLLVLLIATPVYFVWNALSNGAPDAPRLAQLEPEPKPQPQREPEPKPEPAEATPVPQKLARQAEPTPPEPARPTPVAREPKPAVEIAARLPSEPPRYRPGTLAGMGRLIGGAARGAAGAAAVPQVLAPAHVGRTSRASPTLYWLLSAASDRPAELTVMDPDGVEPLLETALPGPLAAGVHALRLADHDVRLAPGVDYQWFVALVRDPARRSNDLVSGAIIRYEPGSAPPATTPPEGAAHAYAEAGLWYDAFDQVVAWLAAEPNAAILHAYRASLLEQVGLEAVARPQ